MATGSDDTGDFFKTGDSPVMSHMRGEIALRSIQNAIAKELGIPLTDSDPNYDPA